MRRSKIFRRPDRVWLLQQRWPMGMPVANALV
jgi:hypothetical protein